MTLTELLKQACEAKASDLHITTGMPPLLRINGGLTALEGYEPLTASETAELASQIMGDVQKRQLEETGQSDFSYGVTGLGRFRANIFKQRGSVGLALRIIPDKVPGFEELGLPDVVRTLVDKTRGLIVVTGPTGSGKSTTLASMLDWINRHKSCHIITLEDPIEYLHQHRMSIINQREVGSDTVSFAAGLRAALREDPDVILVGEMRDLETIATTVTAAETGHLVFATLHTNDSVQAIDRIIDVFPPHQQQQIRIQLSSTLVAVIAQQLLPRLDGKGRVAAIEVMVVTPAIRNLIREGKTHQIYSNLETGGRYGMQTLDSALASLYKKNLISIDEALTHAIDPEEFRRRLA